LGEGGVAAKSAKAEFPCRPNGDIVFSRQSCDNNLEFDHLPIGGHRISAANSCNNNSGVNRCENILRQTAATLTALQ
jgi:hypothetical protein